MSYDVSLYDEQGPIGDMWITPGSTAGIDALIKEACGQYPSQWDGMQAEELYWITHEGLHKIQQHQERLRTFYTLEQISNATDFLKRVAKNCAEHLNAQVDITISG